MATICLLIDFLEGFDYRLAHLDLNVMPLHRDDGNDNIALTAAHLDAAAEMLNQLTGKIFSASEAKELISRLVCRDHSGSCLVGAWSDDRTDFLGMATLTTSFTLLHGLTGSIQDVVVHEKARGQKLGEKLMLTLHQIAKVIGVSQIELTSKPERVAANKLYQKIGYQLRETNCYRFKP